MKRGISLDKVKTLENLILEVDYAFLNERYVPSMEAVQFITFIKLVNGAKGEEHKSPVIHLDMIGTAACEDECLFVSFRGSAKTTALHEYMFLFLACYGEFFEFGRVDVAMYVSDTIDNGVKSMRKNLQFRWENSEFLQSYVPYAKFTDTRWEFRNADGKYLCVRGFGASTGVRGFKEYGLRPTWCGFDDLLSDKNAQSPTIIADIEDVVYSAARQAMHPTKRKIIWTGTPFNKKDPLYKAASSPSWFVRVYPICEKYPCTEAEFRGAWEDRFPFAFVQKEYVKLLGNNKIASFNQELMLRITSEEDRLIPDSCINWYSRSVLLTQKHLYNFYITTDFATTEEQSGDYSVISVWAINNKGFWFLVDGVCKRQSMSKNLDDLFKLNTEYDPLGVGIEVSGQQGGFISTIQERMLRTNQWMTLTSDNNSSKLGIRPNGKKLTRFMIVEPWFKTGIMFFPAEWKGTHPLMIEMQDELSCITPEGYKSAHDDAGDTIAMLAVMSAQRPSEGVTHVKNKHTGIWEADDDMQEDDYNALSSYVVHSQS